MPSQSDLVGLISGYQWGSPGQPVSLTYSFPSSGAVYEYGTEKNTFSALNATQSAAALAALQSWANVANITITPSANGDIRFGFSQTSPFTSPSGGSYVLAYAYYPTGGAASGDVWLNGYIKNTVFANPTPGVKAYQTLMHELGHALGLKHPFSTSAFNSQVLPAALQTTKYTVMAYGDVPGAYDSATGNFTGQQANFLPTTPMLLDIAAVQSLYGANMSYHAGNDIYVFNQGQSYYQTIWDAGGNDTIQWNGSNGVEIDLRAGEFSQLGNPITFSGASSQLDTVAIAYGVTLENAIAGSGNDTLIGNSADNDLEGGAGTDILYGGIGNDKFDSNASYRSGNDVFYGGTGNDSFFLDSIGDSVIEYVGEGTDTIWVSFSYSLLNFPTIENLRSFGPSGVSLQGNSLNNAFSGTGGNDIIDGGAGFDEFDFSGNIAAYTIVGHGNVIVSGIEGIDTLIGIEKLVFSDGFQLTQNNPPVVNASNGFVKPNQSVLMSSLMSATDPDGDPITQYRFWDDTAGGGYFTVNGVAQPWSGTSIAISAGQLANVSYVGGTTNGSETLWAKAFDGTDWGAFKTWTMTTVNQAPAVSASNGSVQANQSVLMSSLMSATDADGDAITQYRFWDDTNGGGYFTVNGVAQPWSGSSITINAAQLGTVSYVGGATGGSETLWAKAFDGTEWGAFKTWMMTTVASTNHAPVVSASNGSVQANQSVLMSSLMSATDADGDAITQYRFWDDTAAGGYFTVGGVPQPWSGTSITINVAQLGTVSYVGGATGGAETLWAKAFDGTDWGAFKTWTMTTLAPGAMQLDVAGMTESRGSNVPTESRQTFTLPETLTHGLAAAANYINVAPLGGARTDHDLTMTLAA